MDFLREVVAILAHRLMELEVTGQVGAERYERTPERAAYCNGYRERLWDTRVGSIQLRIPKLREGSYFPCLLEPRRRVEKALVAMIQEAYVHGVSTRKVDALVQALVPIAATTMNSTPNDRAQRVVRRVGARTLTRPGCLTRAGPVNLAK